MLPELSDQVLGGTQEQTGNAAREDVPITWRRLYCLKLQRQVWALGLRLDSTSAMASRYLKSTPLIGAGLGGVPPVTIGLLAADSMFVTAGTGSRKRVQRSEQFNDCGKWSLKAARNGG